MWLKNLFHRPRSHRVTGRGEPIAMPERSEPDIAMVIAEPDLAAAMSELYRAHGYDVFVPETPLDVSETLAAVGDQIRAVFISSHATWAKGLRELIVHECPKIDRLMLLS